MRKSLVTTALLAAAGAATAHTFVDQAPVRSSEPIYEQVSVPRQVCGSQWVTERVAAGGGQQAAGTLIGAAAGGVLGHQVGRGSGRDVATVAGAVIGAIAGHHLGGRDLAYQDQPREVRSCRTVTEVESRLTGWRVTYDYRGQLYTTVLPHNPGAMLPVQVSVAPVLR